MKSDSSSRKYYSRIGRRSRMISRKGREKIRWNSRRKPNSRRMGKRI
jgi:hypothetical protein